MKYFLLILSACVVFGCIFFLDDIKRFIGDSAVRYAQDAVVETIERGDVINLTYKDLDEIYCRGDYTHLYCITSVGDSLPVVPANSILVYQDGEVLDSTKVSIKVPKGLFGIVRGRGDEILYRIVSVIQNSDGVNQYKLEKVR